MVTATKASPFERAMREAATLKRRLLELESSTPRLSLSGWQRETAQAFPQVQGDEVGRLREWLAGTTAEAHPDVFRCLGAIRREISNGRLRRLRGKNMPAILRTLGATEATTALQLQGFGFAGLVWVALEMASTMTPGAFGQIESWEAYDRDVQTLRERIQTLLATPPSLEHDLQIDVNPVDGSSRVSFRVTGGKVGYRPQDAANTEAVANHLMEG